ncbi:MAG: OstA-like protein [Lacibacter sp.]
MKQRYWLCMVILLWGMQALGQQAPLPRPSQNSDTVRRVEILHADRFNFMTVDSVTQLQILSGKVRIRQGATLFFCDSLIWNEATNYMQAFGNVHIKEADSINIYSQYLQYDGTRKIALFRNNVRLSDGNSTLFTEEMEYDLNAKVGQYRNNGRIESKQTTLTSRQGFYYADIKDVYFIGNVKMSDANVALASDSLLYNTSGRVATFIAPTTIKSGSSIINTREGYYDLKLKKAKFGARSRMQDSTSVLVAQDLVFDEASGLGEAVGNVQYKDTAQGLLLFSNRVFFNRNNKSFLATEKPVLVTVQEQDSIFIAADTIFSGLLKDLKQLQKGYISAFDSSQQNTTVAAADSFFVTTPPLAVADTVQASVSPTVTDSTAVPQAVVSAKPAGKIKQNSPKTPAATARKTGPQPVAAADTLRTPPQDTLRFFTAFRNVRIYSDSLQAVGDSLFFSGADSVFQLYYDPVAWSRNGQISGDTIFIHTENKKPKRLYVAENGLLVQEVAGGPAFFNQVKGRVINGYFENGELQQVEASGLAECVYYIQDNDSAFVGMNRTKADRITLYFKDKNANRVKFVRSVQGTTHPIRKVPDEEKQLEGFRWEMERRPKSKFELFL